MPMPMGIAKTDAYDKLSELFGKPVPAEIKAERGRAVDAMTDAQQYMHGKKFAVYGDSDYCSATYRSCSKWGPYHSTSFVPRARRSSNASCKPCSMLRPSASRQDLHEQGSVAPALTGHDRRVDGIIGDTHGSIARDAKIPLFRFGFPIFDRVNLHRRPIVGYQGTINMVTEICNKFIDIMDETCDNRHFEIMR